MPERGDLRGQGEGRCRSHRAGGLLIAAALLATACGPAPARPSGAADESPPPPAAPPPSFPPAGGQGPGGPPDPVGTATPQECALSDVVEPSCGVLWGASPYQGNPYPLERVAGRPMDIVYLWHGVDQSDIPTERERNLAHEGRLIHVNIEAKEFEKQGHPELDYRQIIRGEFDASLRAQARGVAELGVPFFVTFDHEADASKRYDKRGTPEEFVRAWRHIVDLYRQAGADNAVFVWNVTGWPTNLDKLPGLWPGNEYVDWISWEAYNMTGCELQPKWKHVQSFEESLAPMYKWVQEEGPKHGIDPEKPVMIGEMGTTPIPGDPQATEQWYKEIPEALRKYDKVRAVKLWDGITAPSCDFRVLKDEAAQRGYAEASRHDYVNLPESTRTMLENALALAERLTHHHW